MKFRFCGEADCPDWLLMQINTLSKLSPGQLEEFCALVVEPLVGKELDYSRLRDFSKAAVLERSEVKACLSAVSQILESGCCYGVSPQDLGRELEQLGLDRAHSQAITRVYSREREEVTSRLEEGVLRRGRLTSLEASPLPGSGVRLGFTHTDFAGAAADRVVSMTKPQILMLLKELKGVKSRMEDLTQNNGLHTE